LKIRILYEDKIVNGHKFYTVVEFPDGDYSMMLDIDYEQRLAEVPLEKQSEVKRCNTVQEMFDIMNDREYSFWRKPFRHEDGYIGQEREDDGTVPDDDYIGTWVEPLPSEVKDDRIFRKDELERDEKAEYEDVCEWIREACGKKQNWADAFIAVRMDGVSVNDYAASIGVSDASIVSKFLARAEKKLREKYPERQIRPPPEATC